MLKKLFVSLIVFSFLASCGGGYLGISEEEPPLPGERIPVLVSQQDLVTPDGSLIDVEVKLPRPYQNKQWPQFGGYPSHANYHLSLAGSLRTVWRRNVGTGSDGVHLLASPVSARGLVFTMDADARVTAMNMADGRKVWSYDLTPKEEEDNDWGGGLAYDADRLYVATGFAQVIALRARDGALLWRSQVPGPIRGAPTVTNGHIAVITLDNQLVVLNGNNGERLWSHSGLSENAGLLGAATPASDQTIVVAPYSSGEIFAMRLSSGRQLWSDTVISVNRLGALSAISDIRASPVIDRDQVVVLGSNDRMIVVDKRSGARIWDKSIGGTQMPWVAGDFIYILSNNQELICLYRHDGRVKWVKQLPKYEDPEDREGEIHWSGPVLASNRLLLSSSLGDVWSVSPYDGKLLGIKRLDAGMRVAPIVARDMLFLYTDEAELIALR